MLGTTYPKAIDAAGAISVVLAPVSLEAVPALVDRLDGICLAGGPDLDPIVYGAIERVPERGPPPPESSTARAAPCPSSAPPTPPTTPWSSPSPAPPTPRACRCSASAAAPS